MEAMEASQEWIAACDAGDLAAIRAAFDAGHPVDAAKEGATGLMHAASQGRPHAVELLLELGADADATVRGEVGAATALSCVFEQPSPNPGKLKGLRRCAELLMPPRTSPGHPNAPCEAALRAALGSHRWTAEKEALIDATPARAGVAVWAQLLAGASSWGSWEGVDLLLAKGVDVDAPLDGVPALHGAVMTRDREAVLELLRRGADPNRALAGSDGSTPLMFSVNGMVPDSREPSGVSMSDVAHEDGGLEIMKDLIARGADLDAKDRMGTTALIYASMLGHGKCVEALLAAGADFRIKAEHGAGVIDAQGAAKMLFRAPIVAALKEFASVVHERAELAEASKRGPAEVQAPRSKPRSI